MKLRAHPVKTGQARLGLPGDVDTIIGSAFLPAHPVKTGKAGHPADLPVSKKPLHRKVRRFFTSTRNPQFNIESHMLDKKVEG